MISRRLSVACLQAFAACPYIPVVRLRRIAAVMVFLMTVGVGEMLGAVTVYYQKDMPAANYSASNSVTMTQSSANSNRYYCEVSLQSGSYGFYIKDGNDYYKANATASSNRKTQIWNYGSTNYGNSNHRVTYSSSSATTYIFTYDKSVSSEITVFVTPKSSQTIKVAWSIASGHDGDYNLGTYTTLTQEGSSANYSADVDLTAVKHYMFVQISNSIYWRGSSTMSVGTPVSLYDYGTNNYGNSGDKVNFTPAAAGKYRFTWNHDDKTVKFQRVYSVTYLGNGNTSGSAPATTYHISGSTLTVASNSGSLAKTGYTFGGWNTNTGGTGTNYTAGSGTISSISANKTLYAKWTPTPYTITYNNMSGATNHASNPDSYTIESADITLQTPSKTGYTFGGWYTNEGLTTAAATPAIATGSTGNKTFYARWLIPVTFAAKGDDYGTSTVTATIGGAAITSGSSYAPASTVVFTANRAAGYEIVGWYSDAACTVSLGNGTNTTYTVSSLSTSNNTVYVKYQRKSTFEVAVAVASDAGCGCYPGTVSPTNFSDLESGQGGTIEATVTDDGYQFSSWLRSNSSVISWVSPYGATTNPTSFTTTGNGTITANFTEIMHTVTPLLSLTASASFSGDINASGKIDYVGKYTKREITVTPNAGYQFDSWTIPDGVSLAAGYSTTDATIKINATADSKTITANCSLINYSITYNLNGGVQGESPATSYTYTGAAVTLPTPSRSGYTFGGWYDNSTFTGSAVSTIPTHSFGDKEYWARWTANTYTVTLNANGGTCATTSEEVTFASTYGTLPAASAVTRVGYSFAGWFTSAFGGTEVTSSTTVTTAADHSIYAHWTALPTVYFRNTLGWSEVYVVYDAPAWKDKGIGSQGKTYRRMTQIGTSDVYYDYIPDTYTSNNNASWAYRIAFNSKALGTTGVNAGTYEYFNSGSACFRSDFDPLATMFVPLNSRSSSTNGVSYYNQGYWMRYNSTSSGYTLKVFNKVTGNDAKQVAFVALDAPAAGGNVFTATVNLPTGNDTYGFKLYKEYQKNNTALWYSNAGTMTKSNHSGWEMYDDVSQNCGLTTTATGVYTFTLNCGDGRMRVSVDYPVSVGDYRLLYYDNEAGGHPSGIIRQSSGAEDLVSFFVKKTAATKRLYLQKCTDISGSTVTWTTQGSDLSSLFSSLSANGVYNFKVTQPASGTPTVTYAGAYTGNYYIRTDAADGGWGAYQTSDGNLMTYSEYAEKNEGFSHYFTQWALSGTNVKFCIANDYNPAISDTLTGDAMIGGADDSHQTLPADANVRFMWNRTTNQISRAYIAGSTNATDLFLVLEGDNSNKLYTAATGDALYTISGTSNRAIFQDMQDWVYQLDVYVVANTDIKLTAKYNSQTQYFKGTSSSTYKMLGSAGAGRYKMRVVYDFKINRMLAAWVPGGENITSEFDLNSNMMLIRTENGAPDILNVTGSGSVINVEKIITVLRLTQSNWNTSSVMKDGYAYYWISLPYDCYVKDIFGLDGYGDTWAVQLYWGEGRASKGWWKEYDTWWRTYNRNQTAKLEANRGYVIRLKDLSFPHGTNEVSLYFPSADDYNAGGQKITVGPGTSPMTTTLDALECTQWHRNPDSPNGGEGDKNYDRRALDSNWHLLGSPSFNTTTITAPATSTGTYPAAGATGTLKYFFTWSGGNYSVQQAQNFQFLGTHAYMTQYAGDVTWQKYNDSNPVVLMKSPARGGEAALPELQLTLHASDGSEADRTFVSLADGATAGYDLNMDLGKIMNSGANLYTLCGNIELAGNNLSADAGSVAVGVRVDTAGTYMLGMEEVPEGWTVVLCDSLLGREVNLRYADYETQLDAGVHDGRFSLRFMRPSELPTLVEEETAPLHLEWSCGRIWLPDSGDADVFVCDVVGRVVFCGRPAPGEGIAVPGEGVYVVRAGAAVGRIYARP